MFKLPQSETPRKRGPLHWLGLACVLLGVCFLFFPYSYRLVGTLSSTVGVMLGFVDRRQKKNPQIPHLFPQ
jgi:hypothetical protein